MKIGNESCDRPAHEIELKMQEALKLNALAFLRFQIAENHLVNVDQDELVLDLYRLMVLSNVSQYSS